MNRIEKMIAELCPEGLELSSLGDVAELHNTGVDKKTVLGEKKVRLLNFVDVFKNQYLYNSTPTMVVSANDKKIKECNIVRGDIFITPSSEVIDEIGQSAMAVEDFVDTVYSYHIMRIRINDFNLLDPSFLSYLFSSSEVRKQIRSKAQGITRFGLTKPNWQSIKIPIPPLPIQQEIVNILDKFTQLEAELEAELEARKRQYDFYRNKLLTFNNLNGGGQIEGLEIKWLALGELGTFIRGKRFIKTDMIHSGVPCIHYGEMYTYYKVFAMRTRSFVSKDLALKLRRASKGDVVIVSAGETIEDIGQGTAWLGDEDVVIHDACFSYRSNLDPKYVSYFLRTKLFHDQIRKHISSGKISSINAKGLGSAKIPVPPLEEQRRIVSILDKFDALVNDISTGLPAEIKARRAQYEFYRGKLLDFKKVEVVA